MIRLSVLLSLGLYVVLLILGQDHGQKRHGLTLAVPAAKAVPTPLPPSVRVEQVVFVPAQPVMADAKTIAPVGAIPAAAPPVAEVASAAQVAPPLPDPDVPGGRLFSVAADQINVRQGPGKTYSVVGTLAKGEQVLVVTEGTTVAGWSRIRLEGDGIEGYVATRLLTEAR